MSIEPLLCLPPVTKAASIDHGLGRGFDEGEVNTCKAVGGIMGNAVLQPGELFVTVSHSVAHICDETLCRPAWDMSGDAVDVVFPVSVPNHLENCQNASSSAEKQVGEGTQGSCAMMVVLRRPVHQHLQRAATAASSHLCRNQKQWRPWKRKQRLRRM